MAKLQMWVVSHRLRIPRFPVTHPLPCEQRFLSCMAFSIYKVVNMACQSCSWFVYTATELGAQTNQLHVVNARSHARKKPLLTGHTSLSKLSQITLPNENCSRPKERNSHMKGTRMLVISLSGLNCIFWSTYGV